MARETMVVDFPEGKREVEITHTITEKRPYIGGVNYLHRPDWRRILPDYDVHEVIGGAIATPRR